MTVSQIHSDTAIFFLCLPFFCGKIIPNRSLDRLQQRRVRRGNQHNALLHFKRRLVLMKTTYRFMKNNVSFWWKQRVILMKTTCHFDENNVSFYEKQRLVFSECSEAKKQSTNHPSKVVFFEVWKYLQSPFLARTRTHASQEFLPFCCHKCHSKHCKTLYFRIIRISWTYSNKYIL